jgi:hypothetical protein
VKYGGTKSNSWWVAKHNRRGMCKTPLRGALGGVVFFLFHEYLTRKEGLIDMNKKKFTGFVNNFDTTGIV